MHFLRSDMLSCHFCMNWSFNLSLNMFLNVLTEHGKYWSNHIPGNPESFKVHLIDDNQLDLKILNSFNLYNKVHIMCEIYHTPYLNRWTIYSSQNIFT